MSTSKTVPSQETFSISPTSFFSLQHFCFYLAFECYLTEERSFISYKNRSFRVDFLSVINNSLRNNLKETSLKQNFLNKKQYVDITHYILRPNNWRKPNYSDFLRTANSKIFNKKVRVNVFMSQNIRKFFLHVHIRIQKTKSTKPDKFESMDARKFSSVVIQKTLELL